MSNADEMSAFETACLAFEIRFESELDARWRNLEAAAVESLGAAEPVEKRRLLNQFFVDAAGEIATVVQQYFPQMLKVAIAQHNSLGGKPPLEWTEKLLRSQARTFLGIDQGSGEMAGESRVVKTTRDLMAIATARPIADEEWTGEEVATPEFALPWWMNGDLVRDLALIGRPFPAESGLGEDLPVADSLDWIASKEYSLLARLNQQIEKSGLDGFIAAGQGGTLFFDTSSQERHSADDTGPNGIFTRQGGEWIIEYGSEKCRLETNLIGFDYIAELLRYAGTEFSADKLRAVRASALPENPKNVLDLHDNSDTDNSLQTDFSRQEVVDQKTRADYLREIESLKRRANDAEDCGDLAEAKDLRKAQQKMQETLQKTWAKNGKPRRFSDQAEKARSAVTHAINLARLKIEKVAPSTARHFKDNIKTGASLMYRDRLVRWKV
jgi:hypothetical protein